MSQEQQIRYRKSQNQTDPSIIESTTRSKSTISSLLSTFTPNVDDPDTTTKKKYLRFRGANASVDVGDDKDVDELGGEESGEKGARIMVLLGMKLMGVLGW